jgi:hypothetical protein
MDSSVQLCSACEEPAFLNGTEKDSFYSVCSGASIMELASSARTAVTEARGQFGNPREGEYL